MVLFVVGWRAELPGGPGALLGTELGEAEQGVGLWAPLPDPSRATLPPGGHPELCSDSVLQVLRG